MKQTEDWLYTRYETNKLMVKLMIKQNEDDDNTDDDKNT